MTKAGRERLILRAFQFQGPMSDPQLAWRIVHFGIKPATAKNVRRRLTKNGLIEFANKAYRTKRGQLVCVWRLSVEGERWLEKRPQRHEGTKV